MNRTEALAVFGLKEGMGEDEIGERLEEMLFTQKAEMLGRIPHPDSLMSRARRLDHFRCASMALNREAQPLPAAGSGGLPGVDPLVFFREFEHLESIVRLQVNRAGTFGELRNAALNWRLLLTDYRVRFPEVMQEWIPGDGIPPEGPASVPDTARAIRLAREANWGREWMELVREEWSRIRNWPME